jgi:hypothetical protein
VKAAKGGWTEDIHGGKLLVLDDVRITGLSAEELQMLESLHVADSILQTKPGQPTCIPLASLLI